MPQKEPSSPSLFQVLAERMAVPDGAQSARSYRLCVRDLVLPAHVGVYEHEKQAPQRVRIDLDMIVESDPGPLDDDIRRVVSYEDLIGGIRKHIARGHVNLVETLAENIAALCLEDERVLEVRVRVEKPDIIPEAVGVGVELVRCRVSGSAAFPLPVVKRG